MKPYWTTRDGLAVQLYLGNSLRVLKKLPPKLVHTVVTSPPYWGLRQYASCAACQKLISQDVCEECGHVNEWYADFAEVEVGAESTPEEFVQRMVSLGRGVRRVLRDDGTFWLNLGDSYGALGNRNGLARSTLAGSKDYGRECTEQRGRDGLDKVVGAGNLLGIPWRVALALQADGWVLRQDVIWYKPSAMPEPEKNRCSKAHEYVFLFTKSMDYYFDYAAIKVKSATAGEKSNKRSVWTIASSGYKGAHFAPFPPKLIEPCILAGTSAKGCCGVCGAPWRRLTEDIKLKRDRPNEYTKRTGEQGTGNAVANSVAGVDVRTIGWQPTCECHGKLVKKKVMARRLVDDQASTPKNSERIAKGFHSRKSTLAAYDDAEKHEEEIEVTVVEYLSDLPLDQHPVIPCTVLDPFIGSGTTSEVSLLHGRRSIGIDLSETYLLKNAIPRIEAAILKKPTGVAAGNIPKTQMQLQGVFGEIVAAKKPKK